MTCRELLQMLESNLEKESQFVGSEIKIKTICGNQGSCVSRISIPIENKIKVIEVQVKELCLHEGLS